MSPVLRRVRVWLQKALSFLKALWQGLTAPRPVSVSLVQQVEEARQKWHLARRLFETATDPDLIDYAIYSLKAAERHYTYLLKLARREGAENHRLLAEPAVHIHTDAGI